MANASAVQSQNIIPSYPFQKKVVPSNTTPLPLPQRCWECSSPARSTNPLLHYMCQAGEHSTEASPRVTKSVYTLAKSLRFVLGSAPIWDSNPSPAVALGSSYVNCFIKPIAYFAADPHLASRQPTLSCYIICKYFCMRLPNSPPGN